MAHRTVTILVYHSINDSGEDRIRIPNLVTPQHFAEQMAYLAGTAHVIAFEDYVDCAKHGRALPPQAVILTFDDGYRDNLTNACPILRQHGLPATFFLATDYIGSGRLKWEDQLSCLIRRSQAPTLALDLPPLPAALSIRTKRDKRRAIDQVVRALRQRPRVEQQRVVVDVQRQLGTVCEGDVMLTWDEVRQIAPMPGMSIGAHTAAHGDLTTLPLHAAAEDIAASKGTIELELQRPVTLFSYPYGDYNDDVVRLVQGCRFLAAATLDYGRNSLSSDPFRLKRITAPDQSGISFRLGLTLRSSAAGETLKRGYNTLLRLA